MRRQSINNIYTKIVKNTTGYFKTVKIYKKNITMPFNSYQINKKESLSNDSSDCSILTMSVKYCFPNANASD